MHIHEKHLFMVAIEWCVHFSEHGFAMLILHAAHDPIGFHEVLKRNTLGKKFRVRSYVESNIFPVGPDYAAEVTPTYLNDRKTSIFGGSNEIQRNIMAKAVLGL